MRPDRSNYEIWFTDWLDGNLNEEQVEEFRVFLKENPDLREELYGLDMVSLEPYDIIFNGKKNLKKSPESLSESQFEHLCIANLENDLTPSQKTELNEIIDHDEDRRKGFELIQKLKLKPSAGSFERKSSVKRLPAGQKIIRLSVIGLSAAATVAILIISYLSLPANMKKETRQTAQNTKQDTFLMELKPAIFKQEAKSSYSVQRTFSPEINKTKPETGISKLPVLFTEQINQEEPDSTPEIQRVEVLSILKIEIPENMITDYQPYDNVLQAYNHGFIPPLIDERSNVERFFARFFHEKIMRDKISGNRPVESYEIAVAGITGLNKLFGWEMALHKNTDENGEIRSYNFTSKLLKFNAPVKKATNTM
jgi:hypothetical protein